MLCDQEDHGGGDHCQSSPITGGDKVCQFPINKASKRGNKCLCYIVPTLAWELSPGAVEDGCS